MEIATFIYDIIWSPVLVGLLLATGAYFSFRSRFHTRTIASLITSAAVP